MARGVPRRLPALWRAARGFARGARPVLPAAEERPLDRRRRQPPGARRPGTPRGPGLPRPLPLAARLPQGGSRPVRPLRGLAGRLDGRDPDLALGSLAGRGPRHAGHSPRSPRPPDRGDPGARRARGPRGGRADRRAGAGGLARAPRSGPAAGLGRDLGLRQRQPVRPGRPAPPGGRRARRLLRRPGSLPSPPGRGWPKAG